MVICGSIRTKGLKGRDMKNLVFGVFLTTLACLATGQEPEAIGCHCGERFITFVGFENYRTENENVVTLTIAKDAVLSIEVVSAESAAAARPWPIVEVQRSTGVVYYRTAFFIRRDIIACLN